ALMKLDRDVRGAGVVPRRLDVADGSPRREIRDVLRAVGPALAAVARHLDEPVVGADPDHARLLRRLCNRVNDAAVLDTDVVGRQAARASLAALVVERDIGTDLLPALTAVGGLMQVLTADVDPVVIVRRDVERRVPEEPVLQIRRRPVLLIRPYFAVAHLTPALLVADDDAADAARTGSGRPDDVRIGRIRRGEPALAAANRVPHAA